MDEKNCGNTAVNSVIYQLHRDYWILNFILGIPFLLTLILLIFLCNFCGSFEDFKDDEFNELHQSKQSKNKIKFNFQKNFFLKRIIHLIVLKMNFKVLQIIRIKI